MDGNEDNEKRYSADFKAKVALEAIRGDLTLSELGSKHGIHHTTIAAWKRQAVEGMSATFSGAGARAKVATEADLEKLRAKIGQLILERDVLPKPRRKTVQEGSTTSGGRSWRARGECRYAG